MGLLTLYRLRGEPESSEVIDLPGKQVPVKTSFRVVAAVYFVSSRDGIRYNDLQRYSRERTWLW